MAKATFNFPSGFLWGTATAAHQVEGNNKNNNWWAWEQDGHVVPGHTSAVACDWWGGRWREDFDRAAEAGQNAHRLSVEWSRIQPEPDRWDEGALDHYRQMVRGLRERGMTPMVTLHHFTDPLWITEQGGWEQDISAHFARFAERVVEALKEYVTLWCTINEPNVYAVMGYLTGDFPPGKKSFGTAMRVMTNLVRGHAAAYRAIHRLQTQAQVGMAINYRAMMPHRAWLPLDHWVANAQARGFNDFFPHAAATGILRYPIGRKRIKEAKNTQDFLGLNYYSQDYVAFSLLAAGEMFGRRFYDPEAELSKTGFIANVPEGFFTALNWATRFGLPIIVTENGVEDEDEYLRPRYLAQHVHQMWKAVNFNWPVQGYFHWSLVDNFEWERGWTQRFGLWELDPETQVRRKRAGANLYADICHANALSSDMVAQYAPGLVGKIFPD